MKQFSILILLLILSVPGFSAMVTLSGYLKDKANGEALPPDYPAAAKAVAERRMALAGYRLADVLKGLFP